MYFNSRWAALGAIDGQFDFLQKIHENGAFSHPQFAAQQIHGLNTVGAFVDAGNFTVPVQLLDRVFLGISISAVDLNGQPAYFLPLVAAIRFYHRG